MPHFRNIVMLALVVLAVQGCDGKAATETRDFADFQQIETDGSFVLNVAIGGPQSVLLEGNARDLENLQSQVTGGRLKLEAEGRQHDPITVTITLARLNVLVLGGSNDATLDGADGENFELVVDGSGDVTIVGACSDLKATVNGSADLQIGQFECRNVDLSINGSGDAEIQATQDLEISISGSGEVDVLGHPQGKLRLSVSGSGTVEID